VRLGGGVSTVHEYQRAGLLAEVHVVVVPVLLGSGERFFDGSEPDSLRVVEFTPFRSVAHLRLRRDA
jgi:dihydrofolate reductase